MTAFKKILLPTAFTESCERARSHAVALAALGDAELHVLHVQVMHAEPMAFSGMPGVAAIEDALDKAAHTRADEFVASIERPVVKAIARELTASPAILDYSEEHSCDLIVMGTHARKGFARLFLGSEAVEVVRRATVPVLVVGPEHAEATSYKTIVVPVDFSEASKAALRQAAALAAAHGGRLIVEHVVDTRPLPPYAVETVAEAEREQAQKAVADLLAEENWGVQTELLVSTGAPHAQICETAREMNADLIVMGTQGLGALDRLLIGSVTERVLRSAPCAVLANR